MATGSSFAIDVPPSLLARARAGERAAFEQLYRRFERPVFTLALRICGSRNEADEVLPAYAAVGLQLHARADLNEWCALHLRAGDPA